MKPAEVILEIITANPGMTTSQLVYHSWVAGLSYQEYREALENLKNDNLIEVKRITAKRRGTKDHYFLTGTR